MKATVQDAIDRARVLLQEVLDVGELDGVAWTNAELLMWANDGMAEIARVRPESYSRCVDVELEPGARQHLPSDMTILLEAICNVDTAGVEGRAVTKTGRRMLDGEDPEWRSKPRVSIVRRYMPSGVEPRAFEVYPPNDGTGRLRMVCTPEFVLVDATDELPLPAIYLTAVVNYICYRAFGKEQENADAQSRSGEYYQAFAGAVQATDQVMNAKTGAVGP